MKGEVISSALCLRVFIAIKDAAQLIPQLVPSKSIKFSTIKAATKTEEIAPLHGMQVMKTAKSIEVTWILENWRTKNAHNVS